MYLQDVLERRSNIAVVGIAGPGDPFANPEETMETLRLVREKHPDIMLCLATNGLNIGKYIDELADLDVGHITITVNAITADIGAEVYAWIRYGKRIYPGKEGAQILLMHQMEAIQRLKEHKLTVKVNSIILPGINDTHIVSIAKRAADMRVDIFNCIPYYQNICSAFENLESPPPEMISRVKTEAARYLPQMNHCMRCRADAAGLLHESTSSECMKLLQQYNTHDEPTEISTSSQPDRRYVAAASMEGMLVNQHLGEAAQLFIYKEQDDGIALVETRRTPDAGGGMQRWKDLAESIRDCQVLLVSGIGKNPKQVLTQQGIQVIQIEGLIEEAVTAVFHGNNMNHLLKRERTACGQACSGTGGGCG